MFSESFMVIAVLVVFASQDGPGQVNATTAITTSVSTSTPSLSPSLSPTSTPTGPTSTPTGPTSTPTGPTSTPTSPTSTPTGPTSTPTGPTSTPTGPTSTPTGPTSTPTGPTSTSVGASSQSSVVITPPATPPSSQNWSSTVLFCLRIKVFNCNSGIHGKNLPETISLFANLTTNVKTLYTNAQNVTFTSVSCGSAEYVILCFLVTFNLGLPKDKYIETMLKDEIQDNKIGDLPVDGSFYNVTFVGVTLTYKIKDGECKRICCGAGGEVDLVRVCSPANKCKGILPKTKKGSGYCHSEANDSCTGKVECPATDRACSSHFPSFAVLILSTLASFLKSTIY